MDTRVVVIESGITGRALLVQMISRRITNYARLRDGRFLIWSEVPANDYDFTGVRGTKEERWAWIVDDIEMDVREELEEVCGDTPFAVRLAMMD